MLTNPSSKRPRDGFVAMKVAICLTVIVAIVALNLDGGRLLDQRRQAQAAADAAALAAAANLYEAYTTDGGTDTSGAAHAAALASASANGYAAASVTVNIPPVSGSFTGQAGYVEVIINATLQATFGQSFTGNSLGVTARGVARGQPLSIGIVALQASGPGAFVNNAAAFVLTGKPLIVNSTDPAAFEQTSSGVFVAGQVDVSGGTLVTGAPIVLAGVYTGVAPTLDPLSTLPVPNAATATVRSTTPLTINSVLPTILQPGVYQGGIHVKNASIVVMSPGVYILQGGGFKVDSLATVTASQVMIYNTTSSTYASGPISVGGTGNVLITAPTSGTYRGVSFFQDRTLAQPISFTGLGVTSITGVIYATQAAVTLTDTLGTALDILGGGFVVNSMTTSGIGTVTINLGLNPPRVPDVRVVE